METHMNSLVLRHMPPNLQAMDPKQTSMKQLCIFFALSLLSGILCFWCNMTIYDDYYDYSLGLYFAAVRPNMDSYVFLRVNEDTDGVLVEEETLDTG